MTEQQWINYLSLLAQSKSALPSACVGCCYEQHARDEAFPGDQVSSTLCRRHLIALPMEVRRPDTLLQRSS